LMRSGCQDFIRRSERVSRSANQTGHTIGG